MAAPATALASIILPQPGGPLSRIPLLRESLPDDELERAWMRGEGFQVDEAVAQASKGRGGRHCAASG